MKRWGDKIGKSENSKLGIGGMRVFPNGLGFSILLATSLTLAWASKDFAYDCARWGGGICSDAAIILIFFLQGYKMNRGELAKVRYQSGQTIRVQVGILLCPALVVFCCWFLGLVVPQWLSPFILLAFLPTTIASGVVFSEKAGGDPGFALGQATLSNLLGPAIVFFLWVCLHGNHTGLSINNLVDHIGFTLIEIFCFTALPLLIGSWVAGNYPLLKRKSWGSWIIGKIPVVCIAWLAYLAMSEVLANVETHVCVQLFKELLFPLSLGWGTLAIIAWFWSQGKEMDQERRISSFFCITQKSLATGLPMIQILVGAENQDFVLWVFPLILFHFIQLLFGIPVLHLLRRIDRS
ncbi:MAG: bile acid:sodium symporter [Opitutales bacterium]|nr:bile acid:sodium symporter [Opitutales bacterium]